MTTRNQFLTSLAKWNRFFTAMAGTPARRRSYVKRKLKYTLTSTLLGKSRWMK